MSAQDCEQLTLFPADSPASPFPWLESKKERKTIVTSGRRCSELSESCARAALSVRTYLESSRLPPGKWSRIWSMQAITSSCLILKLRLSELGTGGQGCSSLGSPKMWKTPVAADATGSHGGNNHRSLRTDVAGQLNPTWVEWLMGFPIGWTELNVSETP